MISIETAFGARLRNEIAKEIEAQKEGMVRLMSEAEHARNVGMVLGLRKALQLADEVEKKLNGG